MKILNFILSYLKYLSPVLISKHSHDFEAKDFIKLLRLNTQSTFGDEKQVYSDRKMGRTNDPNAYSLTEYDTIFFIKEVQTSTTSYLKEFNPTTILWFNGKKHTSFYKINSPGFSGTIVSMGAIFGIFSSIFWIENNVVFIIIFILIYIIFNVMFIQDYSEQNDLVEKIINYSAQVSSTESKLKTDDI